MEKGKEENNSDDDILEVEVVSSGQKDQRGSNEGGGRKRERSSASSRSNSRQSSRSEGHQPDPKRRNLEVLDGSKKFRSSRWENADNTQNQGRNFVSHAAWSFDTSRPPPNLQQNQWIIRDQNRSSQVNRGRGQQFSDDRRNRGWNRGGGGGHNRIQTVTRLEDRSRGYYDNNQNTRHDQSRPAYGASVNSQSSSSYSGDNQYRCNNSNNSDYYDYENEPHQSSGASSGDHHQFSETYDEQGDRFNYNDGYDCHSFASEKDHQKRSIRSANSSSDDTPGHCGGCLEATAMKVTRHSGRATTSW